jgi:glycosyltransferase involved in cell wall biosynthesis
MTSPAVSVVTAVYNGERYLLTSLESVLCQESVDFECVVVNDGSTDASGRMLDELARRDARLRVLHQPNRGLTESLIRGCAAARGRYVARHDADDLSLPGRLARQWRLLENHSGVSMAASWGVAIGPGDETLFEIRRPDDPERATAGLLGEDAGPVGHGSVMFRAEQYRRVGGYRAAFRVAQDWDLWLRLVEHGRIAYVPEVLYAYRVDEVSISARRRDLQLRLQAVASRCRKARLRGEPEYPLLEEAARLAAEAGPRTRSSANANSYFIGKCLLDRRDRRAFPYLLRSLRQCPWHWRTWAAIVLASLRCRAGAPIDLSARPIRRECAAGGRGGVSGESRA